MARIRSIHPGLWTDERFVCVAIDARLLLIGLWGECDDQGIFEWSPLKLKMRLFPADNTDIAVRLDELVSVGLVQKFVVDGRSLGAVRNFMKWQRPKSPQSVYPLPSELTEYVGKPIDARDKPERGTALGKMLWEKQDGRCHYCSEEITYYRKKATSLEIDHREPLCRGGDDDISNLVAACKPCNSLKGALSEHDFRKRFAQRDLTANCRDKRESQAAKSATGEATNQRKEEGGRREEGENKEGYRARRAKQQDYAFEGRIIRLVRKDFDEWKRAYHAIPDFQAELTSLDAWLHGQPSEKQAKWFHTVSGSLNRKHQELLAANRRTEAPAHEAPFV